MATEETTKTTTHKRGSKAAKRTETAVKASKTTKAAKSEKTATKKACLLYTSPSPRDS